MSPAPPAPPVVVSFATGVPVVEVVPLSPPLLHPATTSPIAAINPIVSCLLIPFLPSERDLPVWPTIRLPLVQIDLNRFGHKFAALALHDVWLLVDGPHSGAVSVLM